MTLDEPPAGRSAPILHDGLPFFQWMDPRLVRLPGILPLDRADWLQVNEAYGAQMAERERLISTCTDSVHALLPDARDAARELHAMVTTDLPGLGFGRTADGWICPDGRCVPDDADTPLLTLGRLVQEDFCILQAGAQGQHVLAGAILCFPAGWTLAQKIGRGLPGVHAPVAVYDAGLAARVQRLFDAIRPEQPLWRANALPYDDPALFQPRHEDEPRPYGGSDSIYVRSERQCLLRLPRTRAVVFSIHTYVVRRDTLTPAQEAAFSARFAQDSATDA